MSGVAFFSQNRKFWFPLVQMQLSKLEISALCNDTLARYFGSFIGKFMAETICRTNVRPVLQYLNFGKI
jgi:hypothetical protein